MDWTSKVYDRNMVDGQSYQKEIANKAKILDALKEEYLANKARSMEADNAALRSVMNPLYAQTGRDILDQRGLAASNVANIGYQDGISVEDALRLKAAQDAQFANDMRGNYANSKQYVADERLARTGEWDTPEVYEALKRSDAFTDNIDQGLAAEWMKGYRR